MAGMAAAGMDLAGMAAAAIGAAVRIGEADGAGVADGGGALDGAGAHPLVWASLLPYPFIARSTSGGQLRSSPIRVPFFFVRKCG